MQPQSESSEALWRVAAAMMVLAAPFVIAAVLLNGLQSEIATFHGADERVYHYPVILRFIEAFPKMPLADYDSATTPLFHIVFATLGKLFSPSLPFLRAINALISYVTAVLLFFMFHRLLRVNLVTSLLLALALILSPYVFGISFLLLTDSMALLFVVATLFALVLYLQRGDWPYLAFAALLASCAVLTRQSNIWLFPLLLLAAVARPQSNRVTTFLGATVLLAMAAAPLVVLSAIWGGPTPPAWRVQFAPNVGALTFLTACIGAYGAPLAVAAISNRDWPPTPQIWRTVAVVLVGTAMLLWLAPLHYVAAHERDIAQSIFPSEGFLWRLSQPFPSLAGTSLLFWVLVPIGIAILWRGWERDGVRSLPIMIYLFAGATLINLGATYQKYFDYLAFLIIFFVLFADTGYRRTSTNVVLALYCCAFIAYAAANPYKRIEGAAVHQSHRLAATCDDRCALGAGR